MAPADQYYDQANPDLLYRIPATAHSVLELGCGTGALGRAFKTINPEVIYIGIELMPEPAAKARKVLDHVIEGDISQQAFKTLPGAFAQVDCLVFGDVLEHLIDPEAALKKLIPLLKDNGKLLACIPNVQHWSVIANLLSGQWPQEDQGIFDSTHLRWFTKQSICTLLEGVGLQIQSITPRIFGADKAKQFVTALKPALENLNLNTQTFTQDTSALQYVIQARKSNINELRIDGLTLQPQAGMNDVRMIQPLRSVASLQKLNIELQLSANQLRLLSAESLIPRIMIWQRQMLTYKNSLDQLRLAIKSGYILISEFDDDPDHWPAIKENKDLNFRAMHAVQVSTPSLANKISASNPEVAIFENCLEKLPAIPDEKWSGAWSNKSLRLFYGALNRKESWQKWITALNQAINQAPEKWEIEVIHDKEFFSALTTSRKRFTPTCNYATYLERLQNCHIGLLPLESNNFNQHKSDLKFVEAAGCAVAAIASPTVYAKTIVANKTGMICEDGDELFSILTNWAGNPDQAREIATNARRWCKNNRLQYSQSERRLQWYQSLWERRAELTNALLERVPELASQSR